METCALTRNLLPSTGKCDLDLMDIRYALTENIRSKVVINWYVNMVASIKLHFDKFSITEFQCKLKTHGFSQFFVSPEIVMISRKSSP